MTKNIIDRIRENDPSFDPLGVALECSGVTREQYNAAADRIYIDGYYGPVSDTDWAEQDGREPRSVEGARELCHKVWAEVDDYKFEEYLDCGGYCGESECEGHLEVVATVDRREILNAIAPWHREIYGYGPQ